MLHLAPPETLLHRSDYREFAELCMVFLDKDDAGHPFTFKTPGALHKACWNASFIYSLSYVCLSSK